jgi:hypothetical protein
MDYISSIINQWTKYQHSVFGSIIRPYDLAPTKDTPLSDLLMITADFPDEETVGYLTDPNKPLIVLVNFMFNGELRVGGEFEGTHRNTTLALQGFVHTVYPPLRDAFVSAVVQMYQKNLWLKNVESVLTPNTSSWIIDNVRVGGYLSSLDNLYSQSFTFTGKKYNS